MSANTLIDELWTQDFYRSVEIFVPELILSATIVLLLLSRIMGCDKKVLPCWTAVGGVLLSFAAVFGQFLYLKTGGNSSTPPVQTLFELTRLSEDGVGTIGTYFSGLLVHDHFATLYRMGLLLFLLLVITLTVLTGIPDDEDGPDFYVLICGSTLGMLLATGVNHLLMLFVAIEMMSLPSYVLVGFLKGRKVSSEAALKYVVYGAGSAGVMLYGISLLSGLLGSGVISELGGRFAFLMQDQAFSLGSSETITLVLGIIMVLVGVAFKLSLVPFHFWAPDAFEGASAEVGGFLSVASKAAAFALLIRFVMGFDGTAPVLQSLSRFIGIGLGVMAVISMTFGNLAAYTQTNMKRLLAYSTIAHAGYMLLAISALLVTLNAPSNSELNATQEAVHCVEGLTYYLAVYLFMNLTAFAVVALVRNQTFSEDLSAYRGLFSGGPTIKVLCVCLAISFFSLVGMPPFGGFTAKLFIFLSAFKAGSVHWIMWALVGLGGLNTAFSLYFYLKVLKTVFMDSPAEGQPAVDAPPLVGWYVLILSLPIVILGASPLQDDLSRIAEFAAESLFR
ncbi:MAG: NADH-quinone oxidoreductase subunit N [Planctomycetota bacterium]|nr:MAG: NADH-quinone oxidoreductase subunit N [Planctomycetota bacterium]